MLSWWCSNWLGAVLAVSSITPRATAINAIPQQPPIQVPFDTTSAKSHRIAIIGAGAAGSSTAYHLQQFAAHSAISLDVTIFESLSRIGGRTTTVNALDDPTYPAEVGASIFVEVNHILVDAARELGLTTLVLGADRLEESKYAIGIWDGKEFVYKSTNDDLGWMDMVKMLWRYGLAPLQTQRLMKSTLAKFLTMYDAPVFPWKSLTEVAMQLGLLDATASTGQQFLKDNGVGERFAREIIQASTRVNYGQNLGLIHGLETMVCMATDGAMAVEGGNWRIFDGMVKRSQALVRLNTSVEGITALEKGGYKLVLPETQGEHDSSDRIEEDEFDTVVIAAPFQYSGIKVSPPLPQPPDEIPYVTLHVTLLTSPHRLSPTFFSRGPSSPLSEQDYDSIPKMIVTTLPPGLALGSSARGVGPTGFWSVSTIRTVQANASSTQHLYKIFSPEPLTAAFLSRLLDFPPPSATDGAGIGHVGKEHVSWYHEKKWHSYPYEYPRVTFEDSNLDGRGLWYTSGMESFISTMETSALMGKNVARLIVDELVEKGGNHTQG